MFDRLKAVTPLNVSTFSQRGIEIVFGERAQDFLNALPENEDAIMSVLFMEDERLVYIIHPHTLRGKVSIGTYIDYLRHIKKGTFHSLLGL